jgi:hypothetical protein
MSVKSLLVIVPLMLAGVASDAALAPAPRALPWLHDFVPTAETSDATPSVSARMSQWRTADPSCSAAAYGGLALTAEITPQPGAETVLAASPQGVLVLDARGTLIASSGPLACEGSADELAWLAVGDAHIDGPVIALVVTTGGHRQAATWLVLYRVAVGEVAPVFAGLVSDRASDRTRDGDVTLLRGALVYRAPAGRQTLWTYDAAQHRYVPQGTGTPDGTPDV